EKRVFLVILFTSFSGSLVSRIPGAVQTLQGKVPDQYKMQVRIERYIANNLMKPNVFFFLSKKQYFQFF
ncbi:hypothetical protein, partial [Escherichia coli]|uniref:hypothetical protein n=1 Tax=Escherichia coli TaxID=562 RepID=UPI00195C8C61